MHIATVAETKLEGQPPRIPNYTWITKNRTTGGGGLAIIIRNSIYPSIRTINETIEQENLESLWITIRNPKNDISLGVFYGLQENDNRDRIARQFSTLTTQINMLKKDSTVILTGDFNAKLHV
jgi:hypothetical protein